MKTKSNITLALSIIIVGLLMAVSVVAWTNPSAAPPGGGGALFYSGGNVGIGNTSPPGKLTVNISNADTTLAATNTQIGLNINNTNTTNNNFAQINFGDDDAGSLSALMGVQYTDHANNYGDLVFATRGSSGWGEKVRIQSNGNVGIGTTSPAAKLHIYGAYPHFLIDDSASTADKRRYNFNAWSNGLSIEARNDTGSYLRDIIRLMHDGNVGIGTSTPAAKLDVDGTIKVRGGSNYTSASTNIVDHGSATFTHSLGYIPWCQWTSSNENQVVSIRSISTTQIVLYGWSPGLAQSTNVVVYCW